MAENEGSSLFPVPWTPLLAVLAAIAGLAALLPSRSVRPAAPKDVSISAATVGVPARLWQDPLSVAREAVAREVQEQKGKASTSTESTHEFNRIQGAYTRLTRTWGAAPVVLVVCEPGSPYAEDVERRIRDRAAVIQALAAESYLPENSTALQYALVPSDTSENAGLKKQDDEPQVLPYESFYRLDATARSASEKKLPLPQEAASVSEKSRPVLVLWLADGVLEKTGLLNQLAVIATRLKDTISDSAMCAPSEAASTAGAAGVPVMRVLGPASSNQYRLMLSETDWDSRNYPLSNLASTKIYACNVSAPEETLATGIQWISDPASVKLKRPTESALNMKMRVEKHAGGFNLVRTICPDNELAAALWSELAKRHVQADDKIAAVAELDTFYGRASMLAFLRARSEALPDSQPLNLEKARFDAPNVLTYTYMMGLDGALPKDALGSEETKAGETDSSGKTAKVIQDPSEGLSQVDYFRRLAAQLTMEDRQLKARNKTLRAVAVLGGDIYDKLQILRTLRSQLPNALFLTDNLDARFAHPDEWAETRNLLVASNYDLIPQEGWRSEAPPFRDSTQAAFYAATRMAFEPRADPAKWTGTPLLFEIGRSGAVRLTTGPVVTLAPAVATGLHSTQYYAVVCMAAVVLLALLLRSQAALNKARLHPFPQDRLHVLHRRCLSFTHGVIRYHRKGHEYTLVIPTIIALSLLITACRYHYQDHSSAEPFAVLEGISIWPGDFLRTFTLLLSVHLVFRILKELDDNARKLEARFPILYHNPNPLHAVGDDHPLDVDFAPSPGFWPPYEEDEQTAKRGLGYRRWNRAKTYVSYWKTKGRLRWSNFWPQTHDYSDKITRRVDVPLWWRRYKTWTDHCRRLGRAAILLLIYLLAFLTFLGVMHETYPNFPVRGSAAYWTIKITWAAGILTLLVTFLVVDATNLNIRAIRDLNRSRSQWHFGDDCWHDDALRVRKYIDVLEPEDCADYLDIDLIARRSDAVNRLVYYPFFLLTLLLLARWTVTDNYQWNPAFLFGIGANSAWTIYCAIRLPIEAREARRKSLARLRGKLFVRRVEEAESAKDKSADSKRPDIKVAPDGKRLCTKSCVCALEQVIKEIENMNRGAFVGIWQQPIVHAVLFPSGGLGISALFELLPH